MRKIFKMSRAEGPCCPVCDSKVYGRSDKIYCTPRCKDKAYAQTRKEYALATKVVMDQLARNHFVLDLFSGGAEKFTISLAALKDKGFDPAFVTGVAHHKMGSRFHIFDFSWYPTKTQNLVIFRNNADRPLSEYTYKRWERHHKLQAQTFQHEVGSDRPPG